MSSADPSSASPPSAPPRPRPRLSKRGSFYDAENDKYYLRDPSSAPGHSERAPLHALNGALKEKTVVNERLQRAPLAVLRHGEIEVPRAGAKPERERSG